MKKQFSRRGWILSLVCLTLCGSAAMMFWKTGTRDPREARLLALVDVAEQNPEAMAELKSLLAAGVSPNTVRPEVNGSLPARLYGMLATHNPYALWSAWRPAVSALDIACYSTTMLHERNAFRSFVRPNTIKALVEAGADPNRVDFAGHTPLVYAFYDNDATTARLLIEHGARATPDFFGYLHSSILYKRPAFDSQLVDLAIQAGANVDGPTHAQVRPLQVALERGDTQLTAELLKHGANTQLPDRRGQTPLMLAQSILGVPNVQYNRSSGGRPTDQSDVAAARLVVSGSTRR